MPAPSRPAARQPARQPAEPAQPARRKTGMGTETFLMIGGAALAAAVLIVVAIYGFPRSGEEVGPRQPAVSTGQNMKIGYSSAILTVENCDPFQWNDVEIRINADPEDDAGGYSLHVGTMPRGRKQRLLLNQFLSPSGTPFRGSIERVVVLAETADGPIRYLSEVGGRSPEH